MNPLKYIEKMKEMYEGERITAQEPRNMAQGGRIGFFKGKQVTMKGHPRQGEWVVPFREKDKTVRKYFPDESTMNEWIELRDKTEKSRRQKLIKYTPEQYSQLYDEYVELIDKGLREENLVDVPKWEKFIVDKTGKVSRSFAHVATKVNKPFPTDLLPKKKLELAEKLIDAENLKFDGVFWRAKGKEGKGTVPSLFQGKVIPEGSSWGISEGFQKDLQTLVKNKLHKRVDKVRGAFNFVMNNPDYQLKTNSIKTEIRKLMKEPSDFFNPKSKTGMANVWKELSKPYEYTDLKTGKVENKLEKIMLKLKHMPPDSDKSIGYLLEMAENHRLGRTGFSDWEKLAGRKPEQWAMQEVNRAWAKKDPSLKFYDMNGKPITWEAGKKFKSSEILFSYADKDFPGFNNKLYSFYKPGKEALEKINELNPDKKVFALDGNIRNLDEFKEVVEIVEGRNNLNNTKMFNPFRNKETTYKTYFEDIYKQVGVAGKKGDYTRARAMSAHIDHEFGRGKNLFNNLRLSTGQQNQMFKTLEDAALKNPELRPYVQALEAEIYGGGSIDNQIKSIVKQTDDIGKIVASSPGKVILPTAMDTAAYKFLKNEIPGMPESVIRYLTPYAEKAEGVLKGQTPKLEKALTQGKAWNNVINNSKVKITAKALESAGVTDICSTQLVKKSGGGRIGFAKKVCGTKFAEQNPDGFMKAAANHPDAAKLFKSGNMAKHLMKAKNWAKSNMGPAGWIGGELLVVGLGTAWDMSQGKGWKEAMDNWTGLGGHFGQAEKRLKEIGMEQGYSEAEINDAMKIGQLMDLSTEAEGKQWELEQVQEAQDIGGTARVKYNPKFPGAYKPTQGQYQDPKAIRELKTETPKLWEKGTELYESLKDFGSSTELYDELQQKKAKEEYERKMKLRERPRHFTQQFGISAKPEFEPWVPEYAGGGMVEIRKPNALPPTGGPMSQGLRSLYNNGRKW